MKAEDFELLKQFVLDKNKYFDWGFANAFKDAETQALYVQDGKDRKAMFPNDTLGNYFYLRNEMATRHEVLADERLADNGSQRVVFRDGITVYLVAIVKNADAYLLIDNLRNTAMMYTGMNVVPVQTIWNREQILKEELTGMKKENITPALQRLKNETIVKLTLQCTKIFIPGNCINEL
jgi:hypothetical protein